MEFQCWYLCALVGKEEAVVLPCRCALRGHPSKAGKEPTAQPNCVLQSEWQNTRCPQHCKAAGKNKWIPMDQKAQNFPALKIQEGQNANKASFTTASFLYLISFHEQYLACLEMSRSGKFTNFLLWVCSVAVFGQKVHLVKMSASLLMLFLVPSFPLILRIGGRKSPKVQKFRWKAMKCLRREQRKKVDYPRKKRKL